METHPFTPRRIVLALALLSLLAFPKAGFAAMLSISPSSGKHAVGSTFTVSVRVSSYTKEINAASGVLLYPPGKLSVISISKAGSVLTNWLPPGVERPVHVPSSGTISFEGVSLSGYQGAPAQVFSVTFRVLAEGTADLSFEKGSVLANDGQGTEVVQALGTATYSLVSAPPEPKPAPDTVPEPEASVAPIPEPAALPTPAPAPSPFQELFENAYIRYALVSIGALLAIILALLIWIMRLLSKIRRLEARRKAAHRHPREKIIVRSDTPISFD